MISLEGLTLTTGRSNEAGWILRTFAHYVRDGLIPNMFPEGEKEGLYHTADATLWFFHAIHRYVQLTGDRTTLQAAAAQAAWTSSSTTCAARASASAWTPPTDCCGRAQQGYQLTWMDAKVGDWVVTPRRGKAVEINALWYNALRLLEEWLREEGDERARAADWRHAPTRVRESFNRRFWYEQGGYLYDVVDAETGGNDDACRPNQVLAISLDHPVLNRDAGSRDGRGDRTPADAGGSALARARHPRLQVEILRRPALARRRISSGHGLGLADRPVHRRLAEALSRRPRAGARVARGLRPAPGRAMHRPISEVFDAEPPYTPRGCIAQAWSVAEVLRCWVKTK